MKKVKILSLLGALVCVVHTAIHAQFANNPCNQGRAEDVGKEDPRNPQAVCFPEVGRMGLGTLRLDLAPNNLFGLGDINHDYKDDWAAVRTYDQGGKSGHHLYIYFGAPSGVPVNKDSGQRVGPTETESQTKLLAHGDWDGDGNIDLCCRIQLKGDTSFGNVGGHYYIRQCVVFWGQDSGRYTIYDTTRLSNGVGAWGGPTSACTVDATGDNLADLVIHDSNGQGLQDGQLIPCAKFFIFKGSASNRWGKNGISNWADFTWWTIASGGYMLPIDHNGDGIIDIAVIRDNEQDPGYLGVLYGRAGDFPDTSAFEQVDLLLSNGHCAILTDVTGDKVPELIVNSGSEERLKVFVGIRGQRLKDQYGTGIDPAPLDSQRWWGRPWLKLRQALAIHSEWGNSFNPLWNLGDGNLDGISDIYTISDPFLVVYSGGRFLDERIDGLVDLRTMGTIFVTVAPLGNIFGDGKNIIAIRNQDGLVVFVQASKTIPNDGLKPPRFPDGTLVGVHSTADYDRKLLSLTVEPNPANGHARLRWNNASNDPVGLRIYNAIGACVFEELLTRGMSAYTLITSALPKGTYFATITIASLHESVMFIIP